MTLAVDKGIAYCQDNYFKDPGSLESAFRLADIVYTQGSKINDVNHLVAETMTTMISEEHGLGFLGPYLLQGPESMIIQEIEKWEKEIVTFVVMLGLDKIDAAELVEPEEISKAFHTWLHSDTSEGLGSMNGFLCTQLCNQIKPLVFGMWLPFILIAAFFIIANLIEIAAHRYQKRKSLQDKPLIDTSP